MFRIKDSNTGTPLLEVLCWDGTSSFLSHSEAFTVGASAWHHCMFVHDAAANTIQLYYDGAALGSTGATGGNDLDDQENGFRVGTAAVSGGWFNGLIDDVRVYDTALSSANADALYNSGNGDWPS